MAIICDGMGGLSKGELASAHVIRAFDKWFETSLPELAASVTLPEIGADMERLLHRLNAENLLMAPPGPHRHALRGRGFRAHSSPGAPSSNQRRGIGQTIFHIEHNGGKDLWRTCGRGRAGGEGAEPQFVSHVKDSLLVKSVCSRCENSLRHPCRCLFPMISP